MGEGSDRHCDCLSRDIPRALAGDVELTGP
jgi:hypothetical protein